MKLTKQQSRLLLAVLLIALFQMPHLALTPAIDKIQSVVFPARSLSEVQEAFSLTNFVIPIMAVISALLINRGVLTKRASVLGGLCLLTVCGVTAILLHTQFWHLRLLSVILGAALGLFISNAMGIMFDNFSSDERQKIAGYQTSCINGGGILMSLAGGALGAYIWFGGYLVLLAGVLIAAYAFFALPKTARALQPRAKENARRSKLRPRVYYYSAVIGVFMVLHTVGGANISTHLTQAGASNPALAGFAVAVQMAGGVLTGIFFGKLSAKLGDLLLSAACLALFVGYALLGVFPHSIPVTFAAMFIAGMSMSLMVPRCMFAISSLVDESSSALATAISNSVTPSLGGFISPFFFTRVTLRLFGEATGPRYLFTAGAAILVAAALTLVTLRRRVSEPPAARQE
ncbi:MAG: MFS transporter [Oscillospiraceae bacterium]|nr:MFS transporter [Oscillospiraceae bacterium]